MDHPVPHLGGKAHESKTAPRSGVSLQDEDGTRNPNASAGAASPPSNSTLTTATETKGMRARARATDGQCAEHIRAEAKDGAVRNTEIGCIHALW